MCAVAVFTVEKHVLRFMVTTRHLFRLLIEGWSLVDVDPLTFDDLHSFQRPATLYAVLVISVVEVVSATPAKCEFFLVSHTKYFLCSISMLGPVTSNSKFSSPSSVK